NRSSILLHPAWARKRDRDRSTRTRYDAGFFVEEQDLGIRGPLIDREDVAHRHVSLASRPDRISRRERRENGSLAEIAENAEKKWHRPPSFSHDREAKEGGRRHAFSAIFALFARDPFSLRPRREIFASVQIANAPPVP